MPSVKEIKNRIASVQNTKKITNAMYLISSTKMRKAKSELDLTRPFFEAVKREMARITGSCEDLQSPFFKEKEGVCGYLVITADKGLAGAYNQNVQKEALRLMKEDGESKLYVVGECGRHFFTSHNIPIEKSFLYTAQNPSMHRAREIADTLVDAYLSGALAKIYIIYTDMENAVSSRVKSAQLLPLFCEKFASEKINPAAVEFVPSVKSVIENIVPSYAAGFIYSALIDSFCSEQSARMNAMDSANRNAEKLLAELSVLYNHVRQSAITQEITEVSSGAKSMRRKAEAKKGVQSDVKR